ncbi:MAG: hypothetical protein ACERKD_12820 [Prolixibacteraceae bacterium]
MSINSFANLNSDENDRRFSVGVIPVLSYDADLGMKFGGVFNFFDSKTKRYPDYNQYLNLKSTYSTNQTWNVQALFESTRIIPKATTLFEMTFNNDHNLDFFGFNGVQSVVADFDGCFYSQKRRYVKARGAIQKNIFGSKLRTVTGVSLNWFQFRAAKNQMHNDQPTLYEQYREWGILHDDEANGGNAYYYLLGLMYDTRDKNIQTTNGTWLEGFLVHAPKGLNSYHFSKLVVTYRGYKSLIRNKWMLAARISWQERLSGNIPYYLLPFYFDSQINEDGLGGAYTMRGITRNRIVADGFILGNFETRIDWAKVHLFNTDFMLGSTLFCDVAQVTQNHAINLSNVPDAWKSKLFTNAPQRPAAAFGPGLNIIYNENNIITVNYGFSSNPQLGLGGFYVGSKFLF